MFKTAYSEHERRFTPHGDHLEKEYGYNKRGELEETGVVDVYEKIQECAEETKIINILKRMTAGDTTMLRPDGIYEDISNIPRDFNSQMEMMRQAKTTMDELATTQTETPVETKTETPTEPPTETQTETKGEAER